MNWGKEIEGKDIEKVSGETKRKEKEKQRD